MAWLKWLILRDGAGAPPQDEEFLMVRSVAQQRVSNQRGGAMPTSIFLARLLGVPLLVIGAAMLLNQAYYRALIGEVIASKAGFYVASALGVIVGLAIVLAHNVWTADWRVLITLFGWFHFLRGVVSVLFPAQAMAFAARHIAGSQRVPLVPGSVAIVLGLIFCFYGYL
jgi:hypothetical protein